MPRKFKCCVPCCDKEEQISHRFPVYYEDVYNVWVERVGIEKLKKIDPLKVYYLKICHKHFDEECKIPGSKKLKHFSLPTLFLPGGPYEENFLFPNSMATKHIEHGYASIALNASTKNDFCSVEERNTNIVHRGYRESVNISYRLNNFTIPTKVYKKSNITSSDVPKQEVIFLDCDKKFEDFINKQIVNQLDIGDSIFNTEFGRINYTDDLYTIHDTNVTGLSNANYITLNNINLINVNNIDNNNLIQEKSYLREELCRLCAKELSPDDLVLIFDSKYNYSEMLEICLPGKIKENDELPQNICAACKIKLETCFKYLKSFVEADNILRNIFVKQDISLIENNIYAEVPEETQNDFSLNLLPNNDENKNSINKFQCKICSQIYKNDKDLTGHIIFDHPNKYKSIKVDLKIAKINLGKENKICIDSKIKNNKQEISKMTFECMKCLKLFKNKKKVLEHSLSEHPGEKRCLYKIKMYECMICNSYHPNKNELTKHFKFVHPTNKGKLLGRVIRRRNKYSTLACTRCNKTFTNLKIYRKHMKSHIVPVFTCDKCGHNFDKVYKLKEHNRTHTVPKFYNCLGCDQVFTSTFELYKHEEIHKKPQEDVTCPKCNEHFASAFSLRKHQQVHEVALCYICGKTFPTNYDYIRGHLKTHSEERPFECKICHKTFKTNPGLSKHKVCHSEEKNFICQTCGKQFRTRATLRQHLITHSAIKKHTCDICGLGFHRKGNLDAHRARHARFDKPFRCNICNRRFNSENDLECHELQHNGETRPLSKPYICNICDKTFPERFQLQSHFRVHTGERPFKCDSCEKTFRCKAVLNQHKLIHLNVLPHECDLCDRKFRRPQALIDHRRTHTGEKPFLCSICGRAFAIKGDMVKHKNKVHLKKSETKIQIELDSSEDNDQFLSKVEEYF